MTLLLQQVTILRTGRPLFAPIDLEIAPKHIVGLMGASGQGKSSVIAYIAGLLPDGLEGTGTVTLQGQNLLVMPTEKRRVGLLFQDDLLFPHLSVIENLLFAIPQNVSRRERHILAQTALDEAGLANYATSDPMQLSGGQRARIAMQRVLLSRPKLLLLDEPFSKLDQALRRQFRNYVFEQVVRAEIPCLLVSHDHTDTQHPAVHKVITLAQH